MTDDQEQILNRDQVLVLLSEKARDGSTSAMIALERALRLHDPAPDELDEELDRLLERATKTVTGSVYERRESGWRSALRRLVARERPPAPLCEPLRLVVEKGHPVGYRCEDGSVLRFPERPLKDAFDDPEEWIPVPRGRWR